MPLGPQPSYISSTDAAKRYDFTNDHIGLLCRRGKVEATLLGRLWYVNEESLKTYIRKNAEIKEMRSRALSKQLKNVWAAVIFLCVFVVLPHHVRAADPFSDSLIVAGQTIGEVVKLAPLPQVSNRVARVQVVYAKDFNTASVVEARSPTLPTLIAANSFFETVNQKLFAAYQASASQFVVAASFDADAAQHVYMHTFGALGERFLSDIYRLGDAQAQFYVYAYLQLQNQYDAVVDTAADVRPVAPVSISVASVAYNPSFDGAIVESFVGTLWRESVDVVSDLMVSVMEVTIPNNLGP